MEILNTMCGFFGYGTPEPFNFGDLPKEAQKNILKRVDPCRASCISKRCNELLAENDMYDRFAHLLTPTNEKLDPGHRRRELLKRIAGRLRFACHYLSGPFDLDLDLPRGLFDNPFTPQLYYSRSFNGCLVCYFCKDRVPAGGKSLVEVYEEFEDRILDVARGDSHDVLGQTVVAKLPEVLKFFLDNNVGDAEKRSDVLWEAVCEKQVEAVKLLLDSGAIPSSDRVRQEMLELLSQAT